MIELLSRESGAPFPKRSSRAAYFSHVIWGVQLKFNEPSELNVYFIYVYLGFKIFSRFACRRFEIFDVF